MKHVLPWLAAWLASFWLWQLLSGEWNRIEWIAGASAATVAATVGEVARARVVERGGVPLRWFGKALAVPHMVIADFGVLVWALAVSAGRRRIVLGAVRTHPFSERVAVRAWASVLASYSPNAYVIDVDAERAVMHSLVPWNRSEEPIA